jgi:hypothetical protein
MWTIKINEEISKPDEKIIVKAVKEVFTIIDSFTSSKDSYILKFLNKFFIKCLDSNYFQECVDLFYYSSLRNIEMVKGQELLRLFTKTGHPLNWIFPCPTIFTQTLDELEDEEMKKIILFQFKMEIEEYYDKYYLVSYLTRYSQTSFKTHYSSKMAMSGRKWQLMRFNNIANYTKVVIPGLCVSCKSENPFTLSIIDYLADLVNYALHPLRANHILSNCFHCSKENSVIAELYMALDMFRGHEKL